MPQFKIPRVLYKFAVLFFVISYCMIINAAPEYKVACGSRFTITAEEAGETKFTRRPAVYVTDVNGKKKNLKVITKEFPASSIDCLFNRKMPAGTCTLFILPKVKGEKKTPVQITDKFIIEPPSLHSLSRRRQMPEKK